MMLVLIIAIVAVLIIATSAFVLLRGRDTAPPGPAAVPGPTETAPQPVVERATFKDRLGKARAALAGALGSIVSRSAMDEETWNDLEDALLRADLGVTTTTEVIAAARRRVEAGEIESPSQVVDAVKQELVDRLVGPDLSLHTRASDPSATPVWLFVGVNGVGKTTTIGKLAHRHVSAGGSVVMAAGDTFRAAAAEQLAMWAERAGAEIIKGAEGADPSSVIFDAVESASARSAELVMADTAGRLHTKTNLMEELRKVRRVAEKGAGEVTETLLVLDATTGQNGLTQARQFTEAVDVTGVVLTKLDGSAKGGIVVAVQQDLGVPVKLVGLGEGIDDLVEFDAEEFVEALFA